MRVYLMGFMGAGKSTLGKELAKNIGFKFVDLDDVIEKTEKTSITDIFKNKGEDYFRQKEKQYLKKITEQYHDAIIALGGGTPCFNKVIEFINESGISVYIDTPLDVLFERLSKEQDKRPLIKEMEANELKTFIEELLTKREEVYKQADIIHPYQNTATDLLIELSSF